MDRQCAKHWQESRRKRPQHGQFPRPTVFGKWFCTLPPGKLRWAAGSKVIEQNFRPKRIGRALSKRAKRRGAKAKKALEQSHDSLVAAVSGLDETKLDEPILPEMSSIYVTLHGVIQHDLYHAGQIAMLKKALGIAG